ncbi:hypothetical protein [Colwellia psychrerythraea]|uniref:Uncharacterized protein n=1 Tax=Colwellia psychrerythraea TaxID=28229 RepID=A0A099KCY0_COLPS|nr:hypothetical protein [Colwellia psychrerythraea]KGJ88211.1 hypothetical protein GAB14E_4240 [Colwellia psychrerythraea]
MNNYIKTFGLLAFLSSTSVLADVQSFSGAVHCSEDAVLKTTAVTKLIQQQGALTALTTVETENVGTTKDGYFTYDPKFDRSSRYFNCSIPLTNNIGSVDVAIYGQVKGLNSGRPGGCTISRTRRVSDGGQYKWFKYGTGKGFDWTDIAQTSDTNTQFVSYSATINNNYDDNTILELRCRTTWDQGSVALGQITLTY